MSTGALQETGQPKKRERTIEGGRRERGLVGCQVGHRCSVKYFEDLGLLLSSSNVLYSCQNKN